MIFISFSKFLSLTIIISFIAQSYSMESDQKAITSNNSFLKGLFITSNVIGVSCIAYKTAVKIMNFAQEEHHSDPASESALAFCFTSVIGYAICQTLYNFSFGSATKQASTIPLQKQVNRFKKKHKTTQQKKWLKAVKFANGRRDKATRKNSKLRNF